MKVPSKNMILIFFGIEDFCWNLASMTGLTDSDKETDWLYRNIEKIEKIYQKLEILEKVWRMCQVNQFYSRLCHIFSRISQFCHFLSMGESKTLGLLEQIDCHFRPFSNQKFAKIPFWIFPRNSYRLVRVELKGRSLPSFVQASHMILSWILFEISLIFSLDGHRLPPLYIFYLINLNTNKLIQKTKKPKI